MLCFRRQVYNDCNKQTCSTPGSSGRLYKRRHRSVWLGLSWPGAWLIKDNTKVSFTLSCCQYTGSSEEIMKHRNTFFLHEIRNPVLHLRGILGQWFTLLNIHWTVSSTLHLHIFDIFRMRRELPELKWAGVGQRNYDNVSNAQER